MDVLNSHYPFSLPTLSFDYAALEPHIDAQTMEIHHSKHHGGYVTKLNTTLESHPELQNRTLRDLLAGVETLPEDARTSVRNNGGGHANHSLFWSTLSIEPTTPPSELVSKIHSTFGSFDSFKEEFTACALSRFGSGWAWLAKDTTEKLIVYSTPNQDSPIMQGHTPLIGLDLWEHAYYLNYQNRRAEYIEAWWKIVHWGPVSQPIV